MSCVLGGGCVSEVEAVQDGSHAQVAAQLDPDRWGTVQQDGQCSQPLSTQAFEVAATYCLQDAAWWEVATD